MRQTRTNGHHVIIETRRGTWPHTHRAYCMTCHTPLNEWNRTIGHSHGADANHRYPETDTQ